MDTQSSHLLRLFLAEHTRIIQLIRRIVGCQTTAEDVAQDVFVRLWDRAVTHEDRSLLFRTAQNLALDHVRAQRVRREVTGALGLHHGPAMAPEPEAAAVARDELQALLQALRTLPKRTQRIFLLNRLDGLSYAAIAQALGVSVSTVEKDMIRALDCCRRQVAEHPPQ